MHDDLKACVDVAAKRWRNTPLAFMGDAIAQAVDQAGLDDDSRDVVDGRWVGVLAAGKTMA
ncbi:MAG: hypothetical protein MUC32_08075 [Burkholderiaceae bacterium]|jgi:predicted transcriptional regulator|nr:hypothetical protein [Burkholderiaceae bacterium]